jgi:hypothetical protein
MIKRAIDSLSGYGAVALGAIVALLITVVGGAVAILH